MTGFGKRQRLLHGFRRAYLADKDDVRRLAQRIFKRDIKRLGIHPNFTLGDNASRVLVDKFDRVFDTDDMAATVMIAIAHHGRQGR